MVIAQDILTVPEKLLPGMTSNIYELQKDGPQESYLANSEPLVEGIKLQGVRWSVGPLSSLFSPLSFWCLAEIKLSSSVRYAIVICILVC